MFFIPANYFDGENSGRDAPWRKIVATDDEDGADESSGDENLGGDP